MDTERLRTEPPREPHRASAHGQGTHRSPRGAAAEERHRGGRGASPVPADPQLRQGIGVPRGAGARRTPQPQEARARGGQQALLLRGTDRRGGDRTLRLVDQAALGAARPAPGARGERPALRGDGGRADAVQLDPRRQRDGGDREGGRERREDGEHERHRELCLFCGARNRARGGGLRSLRAEAEEDVGSSRDIMKSLPRSFRQRFAIGNQDFLSTYATLVSNGDGALCAQHVICCDYHGIALIVIDFNTF